MSAPTIHTQGWNENQQRVIATTVLMMVLSTLSFFLRLVSRWQSAANFWWDDFCALVALIFSYGPNLCVAIAVHYGLGRHVSEVGFINAQKTLILAWAEQVTWQIAMPFIKFSLLLFYHRLFPLTGIRTVSIIIGLIVLGWMIACTIVQIDACTPVNFYWDRSIAGGHCLNYNLFYIITAALNTTTDVITLLIPLPVVWNLNISRKRKIGISVVFMIGGFACAASVVRMAILHTLSPLDITWTGTNVGIWGCVEVSIGVISCNVPATTPLFVNVTRSILGTKTQGSESGGRYVFSQRRKERYAKKYPKSQQQKSKHWFSRGFTTMDDFEMTADTTKMTATGTSMTATSRRSLESRERPYSGTEGGDYKQPIPSKSEQSPV